MDKLWKMRNKMKKKYKVMKKDDSSYQDLSTDYERNEMPDYSFKSKSQAMGNNAKKLHRYKIIRNVLCVIGAVLVVYIGYFIIEVTKQVNSRSKTDVTSALTTVAESTTFPISTTDENSTSSTESASEQTGTASQSSDTNTNTDKDSFL